LRLSAVYAFPKRVSTREKSSDVLGSGAGLGAAVAAESGPELGETEEIRARGYWEQVWRRFRRDKVAIASMAFIILLVFAAFVGSKIAENILGHGPNHIFVGTPAIDPGRTRRSPGGRATGSGATSCSGS
jgi:hypothetical protein